MFNSHVYAKYKGVIYHPMDQHQEDFIIGYENADRKAKKWSKYLFASASFPSFGLGASTLLNQAKFFKYSCVISLVSASISSLIWRDKRNAANFHSDMFQIGLRSHRIVHNIPEGSKLVYIPEK